jgi:hypothetical protein
MQRCLFTIAGLLALSLAAAAHAADYTVNVGYADDIRPSPFFPVPWEGSPNTVFQGGDSGPGTTDTGAIQIVNTSGGPLSFNSMTVDGFGDGSSFNLWSPVTIPAGDSLILEQTASNNFDTSDDEGSNPNAIPAVHITIGGVTTTFFDTAQVLNTEGTDHLGGANLNESHQWREIGTFGGQAAPLPSTACGGLALLAGAAIFYSRRNRLTA